MADVNDLYLNKDVAIYEAEPLESVFSNSDLQQILLYIIIDWILMFMMARLFINETAEITEGDENEPRGGELTILITITAVAVIFSFSLIYYYVCFILDLFLDKDVAFYEAEPLKSVFSNTDLPIKLCIIIVWILMFIMARLHINATAEMTEGDENVLGGRQLKILISVTAVAVIFGFILIYYSICFILDNLLLNRYVAFYEAEPLKSVFSNTDLQIVLYIIIVWILMFIMARLHINATAMMAEGVENVPRGGELTILITITAVAVIFSFIFIYYYVCFILDVTEKPLIVFINLGDEENFGTCVDKIIC